MSQQIILERTYTIPFYPKLNSIPRTKRAQKAMQMVIEFIKKHMKTDEVWIHPDINEYIFSRGMQKPPRRVTVRALKGDDEVVEVQLIGAEPSEIFEPVEKPGIPEPSEEEIDQEEEDFEEDEE